MADLITTRLLLHPLSIDEARRLVESTPQGEDHWEAGYPTDGNVTGARMFLDNCARTGDVRPYGRYEIRRADNGRAIGGVGFHGPPNAVGTVTIGYGLAPSAQGKGYASEALRGLLAAARDWGVAAVEGDADRDNIASRRVMEAVGMRCVAEDERLAYYRIAWSDEPDDAGVGP
ncbi:GNAT family N-acetyltransferase [Streptomyces sp. NPDC005953]|uniref:GNAT family N-acetyltransferase n=1 Tax=unclassified Streptomyces TaxID=2593676 RepID=UPI0033E120D8